jgi:hypothetical protein
VTDREHALKTLWRERIHLDPGTLAASSKSVQSHFETGWQLVQAYLHLLGPLPAGLLNWWLSQPNGHIVISAALSGYHPGSQPWRGQSFTSVAFVAAQDLVDGGKKALLVTFHLLDHQFGSGAVAGQAYFSQGTGVTPGLADSAKRFTAIEKLRYGHTELGVTSTGDYFAESMWLALNDRQALNRIDPPLEKLYRQTLLAARFWRDQN